MSSFEWTTCSNKDLNIGTLLLIELQTLDFFCFCFLNTGHSMNLHIILAQGPANLLIIPILVYVLPK